MLKLLTLFLILTSFLFAVEKEDKVEIYATTIESQNNIVTTSGEVTVVYKDYMLSAKKAIYDKNSGILELFDNIRAYQGKKYKLLGDYAKLNISKKERIFKPFFMLEKESNVWISADEGCALDKDFDIQSGVLSGCDPIDPLWQMNFSSSTYNSDDMWLNIYNARIFIYDIPVFYTPYFGFSLDTTRRTGLLTPAFGISSDEGFYYEQPIYVAEQNWWDLELKTQVRTSRGFGAYSIFRFVDSKVSSGEFTTGYFKEYDSYFESEDLEYNTHYGFNFNYENSDVIDQWFGTSLEGQSGLYMDLNNLNDVDYINLSSNNSSDNVTSSLVTSKINLFYNTEDNYFATYFKYYKDLTEDSNEETLQNLPVFEYHRYLETFFGDHLLYNLDIQSDNTYRELGKHATQTDVTIPVTLQGNFFDEYLNLSYESNVYAQYSKFSGSEETSTGDYNNGYIARNYHTFSASTQLTRAFENVTHVLDLSTTYTIAGEESRTGYYKDYESYCSNSANADDDICEFYEISTIDNEQQFNFTQYLYDSKGSQIFYHKLAQTVSYESSEDALGELENELDYKISNNISYYNDIFYDYYENKFSEINNKLTFTGGGLSLSLSHAYEDTFDDSLNTSYITSSASYTYDSHYSYIGSYNYDIENELINSTSIGFLYKKRCWDFGVKFVETNSPTLSTSGSTSSFDRYIYFTINLKPLISSNSDPLFEYKLEEN
ncbi:MAG: LPS-assembly protein [Sulfurimonas sp.]|jgi:LPS-assembly protein